MIILNIEINVLTLEGECIWRTEAIGVLRAFIVVTYMIETLGHDKWVTQKANAEWHVHSNQQCRTVISFSISRWKSLKKSICFLPVDKVLHWHMAGRWKKYAPKAEIYWQRRYWTWDKQITNAGPSRNRVPLAHVRPNFKLYCFSLKKTGMLKQWPFQICFAVGI